MNFRHVIMTLASAAAVAAPAAPARARSFALYANAYLDSTRAPAVRVTAEVPFKSLVFLKKQGWFDAQYEVYLSIRRLEADRKHEEPSTAVMQGRAVARGYKETESIDRRSKTTRTFRLAPGKYSVDATLRLLKTNISMQRTLELEVPDFLASGIGFGTPIVITVPAADAVAFSRLKDLERRGPSELVTPTDSSLDLFDRRPAVRFDIYTDGPRDARTECDLFYEARGADNRQVLYGKRHIELAGNNDTFVLPIDVDDWDPGTYRVNLRVRTADPVREASASVDLNVDVTRAMLGRDFDETLETLSLIASDGELEGLRNASEENRAEEWAKFWAARDPDKTTARNEALEEFLRRLRYVMQNYSTLEAGWRSDRGQVYIRYGPPDRIERASDSRFQGEYEIWRYASTGRVFVFYDMFGLGDYRLVQGDIF